MSGLKRKLQRITAFLLTLCMVFLNGTVGWAAPLVEETSTEPSTKPVVEETAVPEQTKTEEEALPSTAVVETDTKTAEPTAEPSTPTAIEAVPAAPELYTEDQVAALKTARPSLRSAAVAAADSSLVIGGNPGDYLKLVFDTGDTGVSYQNQATMEVFKDTNAGTGNPPNWQFQYYDKNSSGISLFYTIGSTTKQYVTPYIKNWTGNGSASILANSDAVVSKLSDTTFSVKWVKPDFTLEVRYTYLPGTLSFTRDFYFTNVSGQTISNVKVIYGGDTYFGGNDYGYSYWNPDLNMVYVRSSSGDPSFMGISGNSTSPANAYFGGAYNTGVLEASNGNLTNAVTSANADQSYYLQWNRSTVASGSSFTINSTERFSVGGKLQIISPEYQSVYQSSAPQVVTYKFLAVNVDVVPITVNFSGVSSNGYPVAVTTPTVTIPANGQSSVEVKVTLPANAAIGDDKLTLTGQITATGAQSSSNAVTTIMTPPDTTAPVISGITYTPDTNWANGNIAVKFNVTDTGGSGVNDSTVKVKDPAGADVAVTKASDGSYSFSAATTGIYTLSAQDNAGNTATTAYTRKLNIDRVSPTITDIRIANSGSSNSVSILNTPTYQYFSNTNSQITVSANDDQSGISAIDYQFVTEGGVVNENSWTTSTFTDSVNPRSYTFNAQPTIANVDASFVGKVYLRVKDGAGNEVRSSVALNGKYVDENIKPTVSAMTPVTAGINLTQWQTGVSFNLSAADAESGLDRIEVYNNDTLVKTVTISPLASGLGPQTYNTAALTPSSQYQYTASTPGQYDVYIKAFDKSGNMLKSSTQNVKICNAVPILNVTPDTGTWTNNNIVLTLSNTESNVKSAVTYYYQKTGETAWTAISTVPPNASTTFTLSQSENTIYTFKAVTESGKESLPVTKSIKIDKDAPKMATVQTKIPSTGAVDTPNGKNGWYTETPTIEITPANQTNELSPVTTKYRFGLSSDFGSAQLNTFNGVNPVITEDGIYKLELYTVDEAGNESSHTIREIKVDTKNPGIDSISLSDPDNTFIGIIEQIWHLFTGKIGVAIAGNDTTSGVGEVYYQLGETYDVNGTWIRGSALEIPPQFKGSVWAKVIDNAGNVTIKESDKLISDAEAPTAPDVTMNTADGQSYSGNQWTSQKVTLTIDSATALSGIKAYVYGIKQPDGTYNYTTITGNAAVTLDAPENGQTDYQIYAISQTGKSSPAVNLTVKCDTVVPVINVAPTSTGWTNGNVTLNLTGLTGSSGVEKIILNKTVNGTTVPIDITSLVTATPTPDGLNYDLAGSAITTMNAEHEFIITNGAGVEVRTNCNITNIDRTAPAMPTYAVNGTMGSNGWYTTNPVVQIDLPVPDGGSPINTLYKLHVSGTPEPPEVLVTADTNHPAVADGIYKFDLRSQDDAGNQISAGTAEIKVDTIKPNLTMSLDASSPENSQTLDFTANDTGSGIWYIACTLTPDNGDPASTRYLIADASGEVSTNVWAPFKGTVTAVAYDRAGNISETQTLGGVDVEGERSTTVMSATLAGNPYYGMWNNTEVVYNLSAIAIPNKTVLRYEVSLDGTNWLDPSIVALGDYSFDPVAKTAVFTANKDQVSNFSFRVVTQVVPTSEEVNGIPTEPLTTRIDTVLPEVTGIAFQGIPVTTDIYNTPITFTITAQDADSGVGRIEYSLDGGTTWSVYSGEVPISPEFKGTVQTRVTDMAGNVSAIKESNTITVDQQRPTAPTVVGTLSDGSSYASDAWTQSSPVTLSISGGQNTDPAFSGINHYEYTIDGGLTWVKLDPGVTTISASTVGTTTYRVRAVSNAGIESDATRFVVKIDTNTVDIKVVPSSNMPGWVEPDHWTNAEMVYKLSTTYTGPSAYKYQVKTDGTGDFVDITGDTFRTTADNQHTYEFKIKTDSGKEAALAPYTSKIDQVKPENMVINVNPDPADGTNGWYKTNPALNITASTKDTDGTVRSPITSYYTLSKDGVAGTETNLSSGQPSITADGQYTVDTIARDEVKNTSDKVSKTMKVDTTAPSVDKVEFSENKIMDIVSVLTFGLYDKTIKVNITTSDNLSGVAKVEYKLVADGANKDDLDWSAYNALYISPQFKGTLYTRAIDNAGNISAETTDHLMLDAEVPAAPTITGTANNSPYNQQTWTAQTVILVPSGSDALSGVNYQYNDGTDNVWHDVPAGGIVANKDGKTTYMVRAVSNAGIISPSTSFEVWRDNALPEVTVTAKDSDGNDYIDSTWVGKNVTYTISGTNPSGMRFYQSTDQTNWTKLTSANVEDHQVTYTVSADTNGPLKLYFKGVTGTGKEAAQPVERTVEIDKTQPEIPSVTASAPDGLAGWYTTPGTIEVTPAQEDQDGLVRSDIKTYYTINDQPETLYETPLAFPEEGVYTYTVNAKDSVGNESAGTNQVQISYDKTVPTIKSILFYGLTGEKIQKIQGSEDQGYFTNTGVYVSIRGLDNLSGMRSIEYYTETITGEKSEMKTLSVDQDGKIVVSLEPEFSGYIYARATDIAGNKNGEFTKSEKITLNKTEPIITETPSREPESGKWYADSVDVNLTAVQPITGLAKVIIKVNDQIVKEYNYSNDGNLDTDLKNYQITLDQAGAPVVVEMTAIDNSGNTTTSRYELFIDGTVPKAPIVSPKLYDENYVPPEKTPNPEPPVPDENGYVEGKKDYQSQWVNMPVNMELSGDLNIPSGFLNYQYRVSENGSDNWSSWQTISNPDGKVHKEINDQQKYYEFRAISMVGNEGMASNSVLVKIDRTIPANADIAISGTPTSDFWYKTSPDIVITSPAKEDRTQSPITTHYRLSNNVTGQVYKEDAFVDKAVTISGIPDGEYILDVYTQDEAGNNSATHEIRRINISSKPLQILASSIQFEKTRPEQVLNDYPHGVYSEEAVTAVIDTKQVEGKVRNILYYYSNNPENVLSAVPDADGKVRLTISPYYNGTLMVKAVDYAGNTSGDYTASKSICLESNPPVIEFNVGAPNADGWYNQSVTANTKITDSDSGLYGITLTESGKDPVNTNFTDERINQKETTTQITQNGKGIILKAEATDNAGNTAQKEISVNIDTRTPVLNAAVDNQYVKDNAVIKLSGEVGVSNIKKVTIQKEGQDPIDITGVVTTTPNTNGYLSIAGQYMVHENGKYTITLTNYAGVTTQETCEITQIDRTAPPKPEYQVKAVEPNPYTWYVSTPTIVVDPPKQDGQSKITTYYKLYRPGTSDSSETKTLADNNIPVTENGQYNFALWAADEAGNISEVSTQEIWVDTTKPALSMALENEAASYNDEAKINFNLKDADSKPWYIEYSLINADGSVNRTNYVTPDENGDTHIYVFGNFDGKVTAKGYDKAGNMVLAETKAFKINVTKSTTQAIARDDYKGQWTNKDVVYDISIKDKTTDPGDLTVRGYQVSFDNETWYNPGDADLSNYGTLVYDQAKETAVYTANKDQNQTYYFRVLTTLTEPGLPGGSEDREGIPDGPYVIRRDSGIPQTPQLTFDRNPDSQIERDGKTYQVYAAVTVAEVTGEDNPGGSGIDKKQYSLDQGKTWIDYTGKIALNPQFSGELSVRTIDKAGNISPIISQNIIVDSIVPDAPQVDGATGDNWSPTPVDLTVSGGGSKDPTFSGIAYYEYSIDGGKTFIKVDASGKLPVTENGQWSYLVRAVSNTGIKGKTTTVSVNIDQTPLNLEVVPETAMKGWQGPDGWTNTAMVYKLSTDYKGTATPVYYVRDAQVENSDWVKLDGAVFETTKDGESFYQFKVKTDAKEVESSNLRARIDQKKPAVPSIIISEPDGEEGWYKTAPQININVSQNDEDGLVRSPITGYYTLHKDQAEGQPVKIDNLQPQVTEDGKYWLDTTAQDQVSNQSSIGTKTINLDQTAPEIESIKTYTKQENGRTNHYVDITAKDNLSGVKNIEYYSEAVNGTKSEVTALLADANGKVTIKLEPGFDGTINARAKDSAGNRQNAFTGSMRITVPKDIVPQPPTDNNKNVITNMSQNIKTGIENNFFMVILALVIISIASVTLLVIVEKRRR